MDFAEVIDNALDVVRPTAEANGVEVEGAIEARPLLMVGDPDRLQQVVWNLLSNAVKFSSDDGRVLVRVWSGDRNVHLAVRDTGQGIHPKLLPDVFDRFRQADSSYTRPHGGLGLGLAIVRSVVELHGGRVEASSAGEGRGATLQSRCPSGLRRRKPRRRRPAASRVDRSVSTAFACSSSTFMQTNASCSRRFSPGTEPTWRLPMALTRGPR